VAANQEFIEFSVNRSELLKKPFLIAIDYLRHAGDHPGIQILANPHNLLRGDFDVLMMFLSVIADE
jgi:hypothetical protein